MNICEFFDINNVEHLKAWNNILEKGTWPADFIPDHVTFSANWPDGIISKMANAWMNEKLVDLEHEIIKLKDSEFLKNCDCDVINDWKELIVRKGTYGSFNWPKYIVYDGKEWMYKGNVNMDYTEVAHYGGKAKYTRVTTNSRIQE